jgi:uncharacterized protein YjiS (DUF1127 family)
MGTIDTIDVKRNAIQRVHSLRRICLSEIARIFTRLSVWSAKRRSRVTLRDLTEDQLRDIGVTQSDLKHELGKSFFWD